MSSKLYLRHNVQLEPLIDQWYAWPHLIPPATAARNIVERHLKIMESYIAVPQVHASAIKNPKMIGGPFIDYDGKRTDEVQALYDKTRRERGNLIELSTALAELDRLLHERAKGFNLQSLYPCVPDTLRGYVELVYDLNNTPSFRLIEGLLYKSDYYVRSMQSLCLSLITGDDRPFVLSTPRLPAPDCLQLTFAFDDERIDSLFELTVRPRSLAIIKEMFEIPGEFGDLFQTFLTSDSPPPYHRYNGKGVRWRYLGHACILIETRSLALLFDPVLSYTYESKVSRYTYQDLPDSIDYVLITHNHQDHVLFETLMQIRRKVKHFVVPYNSGGALQDPSLKLVLENTGFHNVIELREMEELEIDGGCILGVPFLGEHADLDIRSKLAYAIKLGGHTLLFAADSCNVEPRLYEHVRRELGHVDVLFLGMECDGAPLTWLYGPLFTRRLDRVMDESRRLAGSNYEQGLEIINCFKCKEVYIYAMGQEPWLNYVMSLKYTETSRPIIESNKLIQECRSRSIQAERLFGEKEILLN
jgi:L-ascorbate metabolism protein UlaG (beta-lactamase superfamily)